MMNEISWKIDIKNDFSMILTTDSERADPKTLRYVFFINILQRFHRKFLNEIFWSLQALMG